MLHTSVGPADQSLEVTFQVVFFAWCAHASTSVQREPQNPGLSAEGALFDHHSAVAVALVGGSSNILGCSFFSLMYGVHTGRLFEG